MMPQRLVIGGAVARRWTPSQTLRHVLRPRVQIYAAVLGTIALAMVISLSLRVRLQASAGAVAPGSHTMQFEIQSLDAPGHLTEKSIFLVPR